MIHARMILIGCWLEKECRKEGGDWLAGNGLGDWL